ncbi:hypothetical protein H0178_40775 [Cytobacillus firmus]|nr:hypothetical protein [Cytobacillus firmus]VTR62526.1 Uncharacterised protein [Actinobacillus pleuropneumoniae]
MAKKGQTYRRYSLELKLEAGLLVNEEHMDIQNLNKSSNDPFVLRTMCVPVCHSAFIQ